MNEIILNGMTCIQMSKVELQELIARCPYQSFSVSATVENKTSWQPKFDPTVIEKDEKWYSVEVT